MALTKTEEKLLAKAGSGYSNRTSVFGKREVNAAKKLHEKGLATFVNQSELVRYCIRRRNGNYDNAFVYQGYLEIS